MRLIATVLLSLSVTGTGTAQSADSAAADCRNPTPDRPAWSAPTMIADDGDGGGTWKISTPPTLEPPSWSAWAGTHRLAVWTTAGTLKPDSISIMLSLHVPEVEFKAPVCQIWGCPEDGPIVPLVGWTSGPYQPSWMTSLGHGTDVQDAERPGAIVIWKPREHELTLWLGNSGRMTDSGVIFEVFTVTPDLLIGRWVDGGLGVYAEGDGNHPQGYFCLFRNGSA